MISKIFFNYLKFPKRFSFFSNKCSEFQNFEKHQTLPKTFTLQKFPNFRALTLNLFVSKEIFRFRISYSTAWHLEVVTALLVTIWWAVRLKNERYRNIAVFDTVFRRRNNWVISETFILLCFIVYSNRQFFGFLSLIGVFEQKYQLMCWIRFGVLSGRRLDITPGISRKSSSPL